MTYAFVLDASACSGCKACQVACKDKNNLPAGVLWRRVYEISGGGWQQEGEAWKTSVFAASLSLACNHCVHPKCAGVCPTDAYVVRPDGIVFIDTARCVGCGYCAWACPYDAPQNDEQAGTMTKCDLCRDYIDLGLPPACVASCPMRCLELVEVEGHPAGAAGVPLWNTPGVEHPFPLPKYSRTEPRLVIQPHPGVDPNREGAQVCNREEVSPASPQAAARREIPLLLFTLLAQMAVGAFTAIFLIACSLGEEWIAGGLMFLPMVGVGASLLASVLVSFLHLGTVGNAWRVLSHLRKSWLSREILLLLIFASLWAILACLGVFKPGSTLLRLALAALTVLCAWMLLFSMQRVYQLRSVPGWNTNRTLLEFAGTAAVLGCLLTGALLPGDAPAGVFAWLALGAGGGLLTAGCITLATASSETRRQSLLRAGLLLAGLFCALLVMLQPLRLGRAGMLLVLAFALSEEALGRWLFYARRKPGI